MTTREKIVEILGKWETHVFPESIIFKDGVSELNYDDVASDILPLIEKRDEIIQKQDELINITDSFFFDNEDDVNELRQEIQKLKGELK